MRNISSHADSAGEEIPATPPQNSFAADTAFLELQYQRGELRGVPTPRPPTADELARLQRLSRAFAGGTPITEIVREDRGSLLS